MRHGACAHRRRGRGHRRRHMVEEAVVLVIVQDEDRLGPDLRIRGQRREQPRHELSPWRGRPRDVRDSVGRDDPARPAAGGRRRRRGEPGHQMLALRVLGVGGFDARTSRGRAVEIGRRIQAAEIARNRPGHCRRNCRIPDRRARRRPPPQPLGVGGPAIGRKVWRIIGRIGGLVGFVRRIHDRLEPVIARPPGRWCR